MALEWEYDFTDRAVDENLETYFDNVIGAGTYVFGGTGTPAVQYVDATTAYVETDGTDAFHRWEVPVTLAGAGDWRAEMDFEVTSVSTQDRFVFIFRDTGVSEVELWFEADSSNADSLRIYDGGFQADVATTTDASTSTVYTLRVDFTAVDDVLTLTTSIDGHSDSATYDVTGLGFTLTSAGWGMRYDNGSKRLRCHAIRFYDGIPTTTSNLPLLQAIGEA